MSFSWKLQIFETLESTMDEAWRQLKTLEPGKDSVILAYTQTQGRGRQQRLWVSERGNFYISLIVELSSKGFKEERHRFSDLAFVSALAVGEALFPFIGAHLSYKWPNDVLVTGKKISGTLLEIFREQNAQGVILGVGVNLVASPLDLPYPATSLKQETGTELSPEAFLKLFLENFQKYFNPWIEEGFAPLREKWLERAYRRGQEISVRLTPEKTLTGLFIDLDLEGRLILKTSQGLEKIYTGDILFDS